MGIITLLMLKMDIQYIILEIMVKEIKFMKLMTRAMKIPLKKIQRNKVRKKKKMKMIMKKKIPKTIIEIDIEGFKQKEMGYFQ